MTNSFEERAKPIFENIIVATANYMAGKLTREEREFVYDQSIENIRQLFLEMVDEICGEDDWTSEKELGTPVDTGNAYMNGLRQEIKQRAREIVIRRV